MYWPLLCTRPFSYMSKILRLTGFCDMAKTNLAEPYGCFVFTVRINLRGGMLQKGRIPTISHSSILLCNPLEAYFAFKSCFYFASEKVVRSDKIRSIICREEFSTKPCKTQKPFEDINEGESCEVDR